MKNIFTLLICFFITGAGAQELGIEWKVLLGGSDTDAGHSIVNTTDGGFMVAASTQSSDGDVMTNHGDYDIWLIKLSHSGTVEWSKTFGGSDWEWPNSVIQTSDRGYLVVGFTFSNDGDVVGFNGFRDGWVIKVDENGVLQWQRPMGGSEAGTIRDVLEVEDGFIMVGHDHSTDGDLAGSGCQNDFWIVKIGFDGKFLWQKCFGGSDLDFPTAISSYGNDQLLVAGYTESDDGDVTGYHDSYDYWVVALDLNGNLLWQNALGGSSWDQAFDIVWDGMHDRIYVVGESLSEDGDISNYHGDTDFWVVCLDGSGQIIYEKSYGGSGEEHAKSILLDDSGNQILVFGSASSSDGDVEGNHGNHDMWILDTDINGMIIWNKSIGGTKYEQVMASTHSISEDAIADGIVMVGHTNSSNGDVEGPKGDDDVWVVKLSDASTSTFNPLTGNGSASLYPNPARDFITISSGLDQVRIDQVGIYDVIGRTMVKVPVDAFSLTMNIKDNLALSGVYFVEVVLSSGHRIVKRMIVE